ncbi:MAG: carbohydrate-binding protein [Verrucomicrobiota bacterium]
MPYQTDFESSDGYASGDLNEQNSWLSQGAAVNDVDVYSGTQAIQLAPANPESYLAIDIDSTNLANVIYVDFFIRAAARNASITTVTSLPSAVSMGWIQEGTEAELYVLDGDGAGEGIWTASGWRVPLTGQVTTDWHRITLRVDYNTGTWDLYGDNEPVLFNISFSDLSAVLTQFNLFGDTDSVTALDLLSVGEQHPLFLDADNDGMDDAYELMNGLDTTLNDRDLDLDGDGLLNIDEYLAGAPANDFMAHRYEAEDALNHRLRSRSGHSGYSGEGYLDFRNRDRGGDYIEWSIHAAEGGFAKLVFGYALKKNDRPLQLMVNGDVLVESMRFSANGSWTQWQETEPFVVAVNQGINTVRLTSIGFAGGNIDYLDVTMVPAHALTVENGIGSGTYGEGMVIDISADAAPDFQEFDQWIDAPSIVSDVNSPTTTVVMPTADALISATYKDLVPVTHRYEAEHQTLKGAKIKTKYTGYSGKAYADYSNGADYYIEWIINSSGQSLVELAWGYALKTGQGSLEVLLNGQLIENVIFPNTSGWAIWAETSSIPVTLSPGRNILRLRTTDSSYPNVDYLDVTSYISELIDADGDGMADSWEQQIDGNVASVLPEGDFDADGLSNKKEYWIGSSPTDSENAAPFFHGVTGTPAQQGLVTWDLWKGLRASSLQDTLHHPGMMSGPDATYELNSTDATGPELEAVSSRMRGFIVPAVSGQYEFAVNSRDGSELWLSLNGVPGDQVANLQRIAYAKEHTGGTWNRNSAQQSSLILLEAGRPYYFEAWQHKTKANDDFPESELKVGWKQPGFAEFEIINASYLISYYPQKSDVDDDGIFEASEILYNLNPQDKADGVLDSDGDTLSNQFEINFLKTNPYLADTDGDGQVDGFEYLLKTDPNNSLETTSLLSSLPGNWQTDHIGEVQTALDITSELGQGGVLVVDSSSGHRSTDAGGDNMTFMHQTVTGDFTIETKLEPSHRVLAHAGLMIRDSLEPDSKSVLLTMSANSWGKSLMYRDSQGGAIIEVTDDAQLGKRLKLERKGGTIIAYYNRDDAGDAGWMYYGRVDDCFADQVLVGAVVHSERSGVPVAVTIEELELSWVDSDHDGLSDSEEIALGTDPHNADTDGDGYSDYEEVKELLSDPLVPDLQEAELIASYTGVDALISLGAWETGGENGDAIYSTSVNGDLDFTINVPEAGVYRLEFELQHRLNNSVSNVYPISVEVDGQFIDRVEVILEEGGIETALAHVTTPWLEAGTHQVRFRYENTYSYRSLQVNALRVQKVGGEDANGNGIADWIENRLAVLNELENDINFSYTSPLCVEGDARFLELSSLSVDGTDYDMLPAPGQSWYSNVPLSADAAVQMDASFENGGLEDSLTVAWQALNLFTIPAPPVEGEEPQPISGLWWNATGELLFRKGDELRVTAFPAEVTAGTTQIEVLVQGESTPIDTFALTFGGTDGFYTLADAGSYILKATYDDGLGNTQNVEVAIRVLDGAFVDDPVAGLDTFRDWENPDITEELILEVDQGVTLANPVGLTDGGLGFALKTANLGDSYVSARVAENGPIVDVATVRGLDVASNYETSIDLLETFANGDSVYGVPIILSDVPEDIEIRIQIHVSGVAFYEPTGTEGENSNWMIYTAADFDEHGRLYIKFLHSSDRSGAVCHRIHVYSGDAYLGTF